MVRRRWSFRSRASGAGTYVVSSSSSLLGGYLAAGTTDGRVSLMQVRYTPRYDEGTLSGVDVDLRDRGVARVDPDERPVRQVSYVEEEGRKHVAAIVGDRTVALWKTDDSGSEYPGDRQRSGGRARHAGQARASRRRGRRNRPRPSLSLDLRGRRPRADGCVVGGRRRNHGARVPRRRQFRRGGHLAWRGVELVPRAGSPRRRGDGASARLRAAGQRRCAPLPSRRVTAASPPSSDDGALVLRHQTSERTLARIDGAEAVPLLVVAPKARRALRAGGRHARAVCPRQPAPRGERPDALRQGVVRGVRVARIRLAIDGRDRRLRVEAQSGAARLRHDQGNPVRDALCRPAGGAGRACTRRSSCTRPSRPRSSPPSRSWRRCRAS